jgi:propanol-preferring alcohol dehydrogenase
MRALRLTDWKHEPELHEIADPEPGPGAVRSLPVSFFSLPYELAVASTYWGTLPELIEVIALARAHKIRAHVQRFSLDDAPRAYEAMRSGALHGRAVVVPD